MGSQRGTLRTWGIRGLLRTFVTPPAKVTIGNCRLEKINGQYYIATELEAVNETEAERIANQRMQRVVNALTLATGQKYEYSIANIIETTPSAPKRKAIGFQELFGAGSRPMAEDEVNSALEIYGLLEYADERTRPALYRFRRGTLLSEAWPTQAFLEYYKAIELLSGVFAKKLRNKIRGKIKTSLADQVLPDVFEEYKGQLISKVVEIKMPYRRILEHICSHYELEEELEHKAADLPRLRATIAAHAGSEPKEITEQQLKDCAEVTRELIYEHLKRCEQSTSSR